MSIRRKRVFSGILMNIVVISGLIAAQTDDSSGIKYRIVGMGSLESGQVVSGEANGTDIHVNKAWCQRTYAHLGFQATVGEHTDLFIIGESMEHYAWAQSKANYDEDKPQFLFYPYHVEGSYSFGNSERPFLTAGFGVFPFKYNPDVRNLGEYLFRTGTYPPTMSNQFDFPLARLTGFRLSSTPIDSLNLHAMLTMESDVLPLKDYGISLLGDYTLWKSLTIGAGVFLSHFFSVNEDATTPKNNNLAPIDSANSDTIYYTFRGTKFMGRIAFDPKPFFPWRFFGRNDLRFYSEVALIGFKNFPFYYKERNRRIPIMVGFNVPTFKTMDVLAVELEWYNWNYPNSYTQYVFNSQVPKPDEVEGYDYKQNRLKWSCYAKKQFGRTFSLIGQVAFDHMRLESNTFTQGLSYFGDAMHKHGDWAWMLKTQFDF